MIRSLKKTVKRISASFWDLLFKYNRFYKILKYYPKGKNHLYDILIEEGTNKSFTILDVGANIGQSALYYNKMLKSPKIYSFEPVSSTFYILKENVRDISNISTYNYALGEFENTLELKVIKGSCNNSLVEENLKIEKFDAIDTIKVKTIDQVIEELGLLSIDLLKIDTEGFDFEVIKGAKNTISQGRVKYIFSEVGFQGQVDKGDFYKIGKFLKQHNYILCGFYDAMRYGPNYTYLYFVNALFKFEPKNVRTIWGDTFYQKK